MKYQIVKTVWCGKEYHSIREGGVMQKNLNINQAHINLKYWKYNLCDCLCAVKEEDEIPSIQNQS